MIVCNQRSSGDPPGFAVGPANCVEPIFLMRY
jgi:hypothetical protein